MANKYLDLAGLQRLVNKIKELIPTRTSELDNDNGFITIEDIPGGETQITIRYQERFIVGTSSIFEFTKGYYTLNANSVDWYLDGIKQSNDTLIEIDNRTIEVVGGLPEGSTVVFDYVEYTNTVIGLEGVGVEYQWNGTELGVKREDEVNYQYQDLKGDKGDKGDTGDIGPPGEDGSDAEVTKANVINAIGYTPVSPNQVLTDVPAGAKFTDTVYSHPASHPASMITGLPTSLPASGGNADTVGGFTVGVNVPANAKFTDTNTTYSEISTTEIDAGTASTLRTITARRIKYILDKVQGWIGGLTKSDVGLGNVDNTSDLNKPVSTATQTALDGKVDNSRVLTDVPVNAKFTDTIYAHPANHPASIITESTTKKFVSDTEKANWNNKWDYNESTIKAVKVNSAGNADTVNGKTVAENVPTGAKFTDTITTINGKTGTITKADITALGIPAQDTVVDISGKADKTYVDDKVKTDVPVGAKFTDTVYTHPNSHPASMIVESTTKRFVSDSEKSTWNSKASKSVATTSADGLMASADKSKLNGIQAGAQVNAVISVAGKTGAVTVTKSDVSLGSVLNYGLSTQSEAETGASNAKYMTPLRTKQAIDKQVADKNYVTQSELGDAGFGDMVKAVYDTNNNGIVDNAEKVNGFTVGTNVPSNAKFTDTIYTHPSMHPASIITESTSRRFVSDTEIGQWNDKTKTITSPTEPSLETGDQWHKEI